jgi:hypothetical protein
MSEMQVSFVNEAPGLLADKISANFSSGFLIGTQFEKSVEFSEV